MRLWNSPTGAMVARLAGLGIRSPAPDPRSRVPAMVNLIDSEVPRIHAWIHDTGAFESEQRRDVTRRLEGNLAALQALRARLEAASRGARSSDSLAADLAAARTVSEMVDALLEAEAEVNDAFLGPA